MTSILFSFFFFPQPVNSCPALRYHKCECKKNFNIEEFVFVPHRATEPAGKKRQEYFYRGITRISEANETAKEAKREQEQQEQVREKEEEEVVGNKRGKGIAREEAGGPWSGSMRNFLQTLTKLNRIPTNRDLSAQLSPLLNKAVQ